MQINSDKSEKLFWKYVILFGNMDTDYQMEHQVLSLQGFSSVERKEMLIDFYEKLIYNSKKK